MYIKVVVKPNMKREEIFRKSSDHFDISVKEKAERNLANNKVIELIAREYKVPESKVRIVNGHHHPHKLLVIDGI